VAWCDFVNWLAERKSIHEVASKNLLL